MQKEKDAQEKIDQDSKLSEKWATKENMLHSKIEECTEKISNLGALPQVEPQYTKMSLKKVNYKSLKFHCSQIFMEFFFAISAVSRTRKIQSPPEKVQSCQQESFRSVFEFF